jgi:hypothetical protein
MVMGFIEAYRKDRGIEPTCRELAIAPSSLSEHAACLTDANKRSAWAQRDDVLSAQTNVPMLPALAAMARANSGTDLGGKGRMWPSASLNACGGRSKPPLENPGRFTA